VDFTRVITESGESSARQFVVERDGEILGGAMLTSPTPGSKSSAPSPSRLKIALAYIIVAVNISYHQGRAAKVDNFWFKPGEAVAAYHLMEDLRYRAHRDASCLYMTVTNPATWDALRPLYWETERSSSIAYFRPHHLRPFVADR